MVQQNISKVLKTTEFHPSIEQDINQLRRCYNSKEKGRIAEEIASKFLTSKGHKVIEKNFTCRKGELDLITQDPAGKCLVFVEVKSIQNENTISITQAISKTKAYHLKVAAQKWINWKFNKWPMWRIDFIGIIVDSAEIVHIENAIW